MSKSAGGSSLSLSLLLEPVTFFPLQYSIFRKNQIRKIVLMGMNRNFMFLPSIFVTLSFIIPHYSAVNFITSSQYISNSETVVSSQQNFRLGFFSPGISTYRYVGIWYDNIAEQTAVWIANPNNPINDSSGVLKIGEDGNLVVLNGRGNVLWTTNVSLSTSNSTIAELLDSGNLVLRERFSNQSFIWQSFEHPSNTLLPTMKIGINLKTGKKRVLTSWRETNSDPSTGNFTLELDPSDITQLIIKSVSDNRLYWRSGPYNNRVFLGVPTMYNVYINGFVVNRDDLEGTAYLTLGDGDKPLQIRLSLEPDGNFVRKSWSERNKEWVETWVSRLSDCDIYGKCGPFGNCDSLASPICNCLKGFKSKFEKEWRNGNWSGGCVRKTELQCERKHQTNISNDGESDEADGFLKLEHMKVPDFVNLWRADNTEGCQNKCLNNCSCIAFSFDSNIGCMWWSGNLTDVQKFSKFSNYFQAGTDLYLRVPYSELDKKKDLKKVIIVTVSIGVMILIVCTYFSWRWISKQKGGRKKNMKLSFFDLDDTSGSQSDPNIIGSNPDLKIFDIETLAMATNNFSGANKLGHGGFGSVYKGILFDGKEIAVKRLSKFSGQGLEEFKNEVVVISKLQHRNLVRLLGCCYEGEEKMLIYEYMPNKSLDAFLFDPTKRATLDWRKRIQIIEGISRGILYLHRDSRLKVIHRDLKASNILLDESLIPKISDFGMARIFCGDEFQANTKRVVGTYGYMAPEYAMDGQFSEKSDVFSFGILLLEIVSGKRSTSFYHEELPLSLSGYAWKLCNENKMQSFIDPTLSSESFFESEILRCIHVGLLCVQEFAVDRPTMWTTLSMLTSQIATLPTPKQPPFTQRPIVSPASGSFQLNRKETSINKVTITTIEGR